MSVLFAMAGQCSRPSFFSREGGRLPGLGERFVGDGFRNGKGENAFMVRRRHGNAFRVPCLASVTLSIRISGSAIFASKANVLSL